MPTSASASAMAEKTPNNTEKSRWLLYCASRSMASFRVRVPLKPPVGYLLVGSDGCDSDADRLKVRERIALGADEELRVGQQQAGIWKVDRGNHGMIEAVVARIADYADDLTPGGALRGGDLVAIPSCKTGNA